MTDTSTTSRITCALFLTLLPAAVAAQTAAGGARLSLDDAIRLAVANNRSIQAAKLDVKKADEDVAVARIHRLPTFETSVLASQLLTPVNFAFPRGSFGDFPGIGPVPAADTQITTPLRPTVFVSSQLSQPLSQLVRINLGIRNAAAAREIERERVREQELSVVNSVKRLYFAILQTETSIAASDESITVYRELRRTLEVRVAQKVALRSDALDVDAKLAQEELTRTTREHTLQSQKEQLNQLLGRDVRAPFDPADVADITAIELDLTAAQSRALERRPDVRQARLKVEQAELDRRSKKSERIPDVGIAATYNSNFNIDVLPRNMAAVGVQVKWEPFDWGRKSRELAVKQHTVDQATLAVRDAEDRALLEVNDRFRKLAEARASLRVAAALQSASREKLRVKSNQFQVQAALLSDVLHLRADLADSNDRYQQALSGFWSARADFERALGEDTIQ